MTVITVQGPQKSGHPWCLWHPAQGSGQYMCLWVSQSWPAGFMLCALCPSPVTDSPADEEEQWSDDFVSVYPWDQEGARLLGRPPKWLLSEPHAGGGSDL